MAIVDFGRGGNDSAAPTLRRVRVAYLDLDGTLLGPGGSVLSDAEGRHSDAGVRALGLLREAGVPAVIVSGRTRGQLGETARLLGLDGCLPELGAMEAGYPVADGQTVHQAIAATGIPEMLLALTDGRLERHDPLYGVREGSHAFRGQVGPEASQIVRDLSRGALDLVDNGVIRPDGTRVYHLLPAGAGKAESVARDVARRGADPELCLAVGNSREDLDMVRAVSWVALVANALPHDPELARDAPWITRGSYGAGVLEAVARWLEETR